MLNNYDISLENLPNEVWKDISCYEGFYQISNLGRVKSLKRLAGKNKDLLVTEKIRKQSFDTYYNLTISLHKNNKIEVRRVCDLISETFDVKFIKDPLESDTIRFSREI